MAIPQVTLSTSCKVQICFTFLSVGLYTASLVSTDFASGPFTVVSETARIHSSNSSRFEIVFEKAIFDFPHTELKKFKAFLEEVASVNYMASVTALSPMSGFAFNA
jgi:hypothetical protein